MLLNLLVVGDDECLEGCRLDGLRKDVMPLPLVVHVALDAILMFMIQRTGLQRLQCFPLTVRHACLLNGLSVVMDDCAGLRLRHGGCTMYPVTH